MKLSRCRFGCMVLVVLRVAAPSWGAEPSGLAGEEYQVVSPDGGYCWFSEPRALCHDGKTYTGWVTTDGSIQMGQIDNSTQAIKTVTLHDRLGRDDHNNPAFLVLPDQRLAAFYCTHAQDDLFMRITEKPGDITNWTPTRRLGLLTPGFSKLTYVNPVLLSQESNKILLFFRGANWMPTVSISSDLAQSWSAPVTLIASPKKIAPNLHPRPYVRYWDDGKGRIDFLFTEGHPYGTPKNRVFFMRYEQGAFWKADGTRIGGWDQLPIDPEKADLIYDASTGRAWVWDICENQQGRPVVVYTRMPGETPETIGCDHRYHYAAWDGEKWNDHELAKAGKWFVETPKGQTEREPFYSPGIALDKRDPTIVYYSAPDPKRLEIFKATTPDQGLTWTTVPITHKSHNDNIRPMSVRSYEPGSAPLFWMNSRYFRNFTLYDASIRMPSALPKPVFSADLTPSAILSAMKAAADWQIERPLKHSRTDWATGPFYIGLMALAQISDDSKYENAVRRWGQSNQWNLGPTIYHADEHCVAQPYLELYFKTHEKAILKPTQERFDLILSKPQSPDANYVYWSWADALFMAPPSWLRLFVATGEQKYLDFMNQQWLRASELLYDKEECLFFRDHNYFDRREANGKKVFWSRGNGWVFAALARVLEYFPKDHPDRARYERQFKEMAAKLLALQQPDGLWNASLLDPEHYPDKEASGSAFFCFGLAWGVNHGYLDREVYGPPAKKAWSTLVGCLTPDGKLAHIQPAAAAPERFPPNVSVIYGPGAFLLAGSELYKLVQ